MLSVPLTAIPFVAGIIAFFIWARTIKPPLDIWIMALIGAGALLFLIVSFLAFDRVRVERDQAKKAEYTDNKLARVGQDLKTFSVSISGVKLDAAMILYGIWKELAPGVPDNELANAIGKNFGIASSAELSEITKSVLAEFRKYKIVKTEQKEMSSGPRRYEITMWLLTDFGADIIQHLDRGGN